MILPITPPCHCKRDWETTQPTGVFCLACRIFLKNLLLTFKIIQFLHKNPDQEIWPLLGLTLSPGGSWWGAWFPSSPQSPPLPLASLTDAERLWLLISAPAPPPGGCFVHNEMESLGPIYVSYQRKRWASRLVCVS